MFGAGFRLIFIRRPPTVSHIVQIDRLRVNIKGLHSMLNSLWTVLRNIHSESVCLPSSKQYFQLTEMQP
jgi:hypothetical protein